MAQGKEVDAIQAILRGRRVGRLVLTLAFSAALAMGLMGVSVGSAGAAACPIGAAAITANSYTLSGPTHVIPVTVTRLRGNVNQGDSVTATFTVNANCTAGVDVALVSYEAPGPAWDPATASRQAVFNAQGPETFGPGQHMLGLVLVPEGCFQIDLVRGAIIGQFNPPSGTYSGQGRLVDADNGDPGCTSLV
jgi:hypothetical protein